MTIELRDDIAYLLLQQIADRPADAPLKLDAATFAGRSLPESQLLGHLDYLNQQGYIQAEFTGDAYGDQGANPLPEAVHLKTAALTEKGQKLWRDMRHHPPESLTQGATMPTINADTSFLEKVKIRGNLEDLFDARDISVVVFRTMRDLMSKDAIEQVGEELHQDLLSTDKKALQAEIADLWQDTNPLVRFLSNVRPPLDFDADTFLYRIDQEGSVPRSTDVVTAVKAVFAATKEELSPERVQIITAALPGRVRELWEAA